MDDIGDLRRRLDFCDPREQSRVIGSLLKYLLATLLENSDKNSLPKHSPQAAKLRLLWDAVCRKEVCVAESAIDVVLKLVHAKKLKTNYALLELETLIEFAKCPRTLFDGIVDICASSESSYSLTNPFHPLIVIAKQQRHSFHLTEALIDSFERHPKIIAGCLFRIFIDPKVEQLVDHALLLCTLQRQLSVDVNGCWRKLFQSVFCWSSQHAKNQLLRVFTSVNEFGSPTAAILCWDHICSNQLYSLFHDQRFIKRHSKGSCSAAVLDLAHMLYSASVPSQHNILEMVFPLLSGTCNPFDASLFFAPILGTYSMLSDQDTVDFFSDSGATRVLSKKCLDIIEKVATTQEINLKPVNSCLSKHVLYYQQMMLFSNNKLQQSWFEYWLTIISNEICVTPDVVNFLVAHLIMNKSNNNVSVILDLLCQCVQKDSTYSSYIFPVIVHQFSKTKDAKKKEILLRAIPKLASHRFCTANILKFLSALYKQQKLTEIVIEVLGQLWNEQEKIFPKIKDWLIPKLKTPDNSLDRVRLKVIQKICAVNGAEFGEALLPILSSLINDSSTPEDFVAFSVSAITELCKCELIELPATWNQLWSKLRNVNKSQVSSALCHLLAVASELEQSDETEEFISLAVSQLWTFASSQHVSVQNAAYEGLAKFDPSLFSLKHLPIKAKSDLKIPAHLISTPIDANRPPEDVLDYIPGSCWIQLLRSLPENVQKYGYRTFLKHLLTTEVKNLGRSAYTVGKLKPKESKSTMVLYDFFHSLSSQFLQGCFRGCDAVATAILRTYRIPSMSQQLNFDQEKKLNFQRGRQHLELFTRLILECTMDTVDWKKCILSIDGWRSFMHNLYGSVLESRYAELEMNPTKSAADKQRRLETAWLWYWARDQIMEKLKRAALESAKAQLNGCLALAMLAVTVKEHMNESNCILHDQCVFVLPTQWFISVVETLLSLALSNYSVKAQLIPFGKLDRPSTSLSAFASVGLSYLLPSCYNDVLSFLGPVTDDFVKHLLSKDDGSKNVVTDFCVPFSLGILASGLPVDQNLLRDCTLKKLCHLSVSGSSHGAPFGLISFFGSSDPSIAENYRSAAFDSVLKGIKSVDSNSAQYELYLQVIVEIIGSNDDHEKRQSLLTFSENVSFANAIPFMFSDKEQAANKIGDLFKELNSPEISSLERMRCFDSLVALCGSGHTFGNSNAFLEKNVVEASVSKLVNYCRQILNMEAGPFLTNSIILALAKLDMALYNQQCCRSNLPYDYSYLNVRSVIRSCFEVVEDESLTELIVDVFVCDFGDRTLPPVDWHRVLEKKCSLKNIQLMDSVIRLALQEHSVALAEKLLTPNIISQLSIDIARIISRQLVVIFSLLPRIHVDRLFDTVYDRAKLNLDHVIYKDLWLGLSVHSEKENSHSVNQFRCQCALRWVKDIVLNSYSDALIPQVAAIGDVICCMDEATIKRLITELDVDCPLKSIWLRSQLLAFGHLSLVNGLQLLDIFGSFDLKFKYSALCLLTEGFSRMSNIDREAFDWLIDLMSCCRVTRVSDSGDTITACVHILAAAMSAWCPLDLPLPLLRFRDNSIPENSDNPDTQIAHLIFWRLPYCIDCAYVLEKWRTFCPKMVQWLVEAFCFLKSLDSAQLQSELVEMLLRCLQICSQRDNGFLTVADQKNLWDFIDICEIC